MAWDNSTMNQTQRIGFGTVIDKISEDHKMGLANIFGVNATELPEDSLTFKKYYEQLVRERVLSENQKTEIEKLAIINKIQYIKEMIRIFNFNENDYDIDRKIFCSYAECPEIKNDIVDKGKKFDISNIAHHEDIETLSNTTEITNDLLEPIHDNVTIQKSNELVWGNALSWPLEAIIIIGAAVILIVILTTLLLFVGMKFGFMALITRCLWKDRESLNVEMTWRNLENDLDSMNSSSTISLKCDD